MNKEGTLIKSPVLYLQHHYELLKLEYEYEKEQFQQQTELMGIGRKIKRGMCWYPLSLGRSYYNALNQLVIEVERKEDKEIEHLFEYGKPVCFFTQDMSGKLTYLNFVATVNYVEEDRMVVILPDANALLTLQSKEVVGVQLYFDETSYRLMFEALKQVISAKNNRLAELRDIFHGTQPVSTFSFQPVRFPWLNATQDEAVNKVLHAKDVAIVHGPPGTGKTLLAKAVAGEAAVPFFSMSGSDFVEMFVGVGASRVRDVFKQAKEKAPCIIFIDEIDAVGRARSKNPAMGGNDERENTLNALLTEMDGFGSNSGVIVLAATNRVDMLDKALLRAGRFDRQIRVDLPDLPERKAIFQVHMKPLKLDKNIDLDLLARQTPGFSGADIANVCNEAALIAARHDKKEVGYQDFLDAVDRIVGGLEKKTKVMTADEKRTIAIHEAGHATVSWFCEFANPLIKVTIVPRGQALGAAWYMPEERPISTKEQMLDEMCSLLGGRAAEQLFTGHISTGAMNDLERATKAAFSMVTYYGMSDKLPNICYYDNSEYGFQKPYSEKTACLIDEEVLKIVNQLYDRAKQILDEHKEGHAQLAQLLVDKEVVMAEDVERIFGKRPWSSRTQELMAEKEKNELRLENMPEAVRKAQEEHEKAEAEKDDHAEGDTEDKEKK